MRQGFAPRQKSVVPRTGNVVWIGFDKLDSSRTGLHIDWADRQRAWIVEDDYDCAFHHRGPPPPVLKSLDRSERVLYAGSFSKVLFPGLRLGYLVLPGTIIERLARIAGAVFPAPPKWRPLYLRVISRGT